MQIALNRPMTLADRHKPDCLLSRKKPCSGYGIQGLGTGTRMALNKSTQELKRHLKGTATNLENTAEEILKLASQMKDVDVTAVLQMVNRLYSDADQLKAYADEVRAKRIVRAKPL
ncbi:hypothetical protein ALP26_03541 [Pseudomonas savastanoi pv. glycinea]|nr:hypothetical protein ALQ75_04155 [Pseudomonas savastanoi pv. glycinea]RMM97217.1 hypothetical protein ALQ69_04052 [Pseudomonas savastanoi pv. glycinea]RMN00686.1 hypothetical protein ALQ68_00286 [Pseudomonas savastanoi pv. glycinea]RMQ97228.1 hypothetical protein ALP96_01337 [Pseudomonas savastanoi pv. glycinea]RMU21220.1 hypothetical protein ALP34_01964 [Pseudomonas savastanoi pv. glycinea]